MANLYIIRGVPGSGKTTLAEKMIESGMIDEYFEADMWMIDDRGDYCFNPRRLSDCHDECFIATFKSLWDGNDVAVSNTFTRHWEMQKYIDRAKANGHTVTVIVCQGNFNNIHGVPDDKVAEMRRRFEY